jgi:ubiquitin carboxyl-terminal hydrolase 34
LDILGTIWKNLHRRFAVRYIPELQEAVIKYFESTPDTEVRKIQKDQLERIMKNLYNLLKRVYPIKEKYRITEHFSLSISTIMLKSNYLQVRIDGLKNLNGIIKDVERSLSHTITAKDLAEWLEKQEILEEVLGPKKHPQILQRSNYLISFLHGQHLLDDKALEKIWALTSDESFQQEVFKVLQEISFAPDSSEFAFFAHKISEMSPLALNEKALDVICDGKKIAEKLPELLLKYADILAKIAFEDGYPIAISEKALNKYVIMLTDLPFDPFKCDVLKKCIYEMLEKVLILIKN